MPLHRSSARGRALMIATAWMAMIDLAPALAQRGQFDKTPVNPIDEAYVFTPPGFNQPGKPATVDGANKVLLDVTIVDRASGKPTPCRVNVVGPDGNFYQPADNPLRSFSLTGTWPEALAGNRPGKAPIRYFGHFFYTNGTFRVEVPAGPVRIEAAKGFEYQCESCVVLGEPGTTQAVELKLTHVAPLAAEGWHGGDPHLHFIRTSDTEEKTIFDLLEAEDIRLGMILCYNENTSGYPGLMPELVTPQLRGLGKRSIARRGDYQIISGQEYRSGLLGHLLLLGRDRLTLDGVKIDPNIGPMFGSIGAETRAAGGVSFQAHGGYAQEIWADAVQENIDGVELLQFGIYRGIGLQGWYRILNTGFRFPGIGACDYPACRKLGDCRTYVQIDGEPTFDAWLRGAAAGRSFMTSGPLLLLDVGGKGPGDILATSDAKPLTLPARITVRSPSARVSDVQLVVNGQVVKALKLPPGEPQPQVIELETSLALTEPSWIAARAYSQSPTGSADAESHTNPVYVYLDGKCPYRETDLDWLAARLDEQIEDHAARGVPEKATAVEYFRRSREILAGIRRQGGRLAGDNTANKAAKPAHGDAKDPKPGVTQGESLSEVLKSVPARSPAEAEASFETLGGFRMQLVAHEPDVVDPVAACFDENGGMYVCEMIDYPYRPKEGETPLGRVRYLEDTDDDGRYDRSSVFADHIVWPTGVVCWQGGVYVAAAPDLWYLKDTDGDRRADQKQKVLTGFGDRNQQGGANNLAWHVDHKIYGSGSTNGGAILPAGKASEPPILLSGRDFRFDPRTARFETVTGSRQFGNAFDDWFERFLCSESKPAYHVVLPQYYLARNPHLALPTAIQDLAPGVTTIFRTSPIEKWREIRSSRRLAAGERAATSAGLSHNVIDAAAGPAVYRGHAYPAEYLGQYFIGCSQNNLIHRRALKPHGATFSSARIDADTEFVRTTDTWFRPVNCVNAPDGTLYVLDMSREVIESIHIADDVVAHLDLTNGRDKGRVYRLAPPGFKPPPQPRLGKATTTQLVATLEHPSGWWRDTASRLLFERQDRSAVEPLRSQLRTSKSDVGRMHTLWALEGLNALADEDLALGLADPLPGVRQHALRLAEPRLSESSSLLTAALGLANGADPRVRFQAALTLGESDDSRVVAALASIATRDADDPWIRPAVLSSSVLRSDLLLLALTRQADFLSKPSAAAWLEDLATIVGDRNLSSEITRTLKVLAASDLTAAHRMAVLLGLGAGVQRSGGTLDSLMTQDNEAIADLLTVTLDAAVATAIDTQASLAERQQAVRLLGYAGLARARQPLTALLTPQQPEALQLLAVRTLARSSDADLAAPLVAAWLGSTPSVQEEIIAALASRQVWVGALLDACAAGDIKPAQVPRATRASLLSHSNALLRQRAEQLFGSGTSPRAEVVARYRAALTLEADATRGDQVYQRECVACHRLGERGFQVGPNLALIRNRTPEALLEAIMDPNREVQPNYVNYIVVDDSGRTLTGLLQAETAASVTLARDKGVTETIQKQNIEQLRSTGQSLMPEGLEKTLDPQGLADLLAFLRQVQYDIGTLPDFVPPKP